MEFNKVKFYKIPGIDDYLVSKCGNVLSLKNNESKILISKNNNKGYEYVELYINKKRKIYKIHRLVAAAFLGLDLNNPKQIIDHLDGNKLNNNLYNLEIVTNRENLRRAKLFTNKHSNISLNGKNYRVLFELFNKTINFGTYKTIEEAIKIRDIVQNFIDSNNKIVKSLENIEKYKLEVLGMTKHRGKIVNISHYETIPVRRSGFKNVLKNKGLNFDDFIETCHSTIIENTGKKCKLFTYKNIKT